MKARYMKLWTILTLVFALAILPSMTVFAETEEEVTDQDPYDFGQVEEVFERLNDYHLSQPSKDKLIEAAIQGMIKSLEGDPYTQYLTPQEYSNLFSNLNGSYVGIGVMVQLNKEEEIVILKTFENGPAQEAGLQSGDIITHVNGEEIKGQTLEEIVQKIKGKAGTEVKITVRRETPVNEESISYTLERSHIKIQLHEAKMMDQTVGYVRIYQFSSDMSSIVQEELQKLKKEGMESLILDLRGNPGGFYQAALELARLFKDQGIFLHVKDNTGKIETVHLKKGQKFDLPLVVLVDENSASASEILAGFIQDHELGTIVGKQTYGKGTVQALIPLSFGGALKVTVKEYYSPNMINLEKERYTIDD